MLRGRLARLDRRGDPGDRVAPCRLGHEIALDEHGFPPGVPVRLGDARDLLEQLHRRNAAADDSHALPAEVLESGVIAGVQLGALGTILAPGYPGSSGFCQVPVAFTIARVRQDPASVSTIRSPVSSSSAYSTDRTCCTGRRTCRSYRSSKSAKYRGTASCDGVVRIHRGGRHSRQVEDAVQLRNGRETPTGAAHAPPGSGFASKMTKSMPRRCR